MMNNLLQKNKGYTLLFAVLVSSLVLAVGISILNVSKKEFLLATSARDSSASFYAADAGIECTVYLDTLDVFNISGSNLSNPPCYFSPQPSIIMSDLTGPIDGQAIQNAKQFDFHLKVGDVNDKSCAIVKVSKYEYVSDGTPHTFIDSKGYNTGWNDSTNKCELPSAKRVERAMRYSY